MVEGEQRKKNPLVPENLKKRRAYQTHPGKTSTFGKGAEERK